MYLNNVIFDKPETLHYRDCQLAPGRNGVTAQARYNKQAGETSGQRRSPNAFTTRALVLRLLFNNRSMWGLSVEQRVPFHNGL